MHLREAAREERRGGLDDVVRRARTTRRAATGPSPSSHQRAEAHEGRHLVHVAPHRARHLLGLQRSGSSGSWRSAGLVHQAPEQPVEQGEAVGVARAARRARTAAEEGRGTLTRGAAAGAARRRPSALGANRSPSCARRRATAPRSGGRRCASSARASRRKPSTSVSSASVDDHASGIRTATACCGGGAQARGQVAGVQRARRGPVAATHDERQHLAAAARSARAGRRRAARARAAPAAAGRPTSTPEARHAQQHLAAARGSGRPESARGAPAPRPAWDRCPARSMPSARGDDLVVREAVEAHQPVGLVQPVLAHQRRRLQRQRARRIGDRAEGRVVDALAAGRRRTAWRWSTGCCGRRRRRRRRSSACSARPARTRRLGARRARRRLRRDRRARGVRLSFASSMWMRSRAIERRMAAPSFSGASARRPSSVGSSMLMLSRSA